MTDLYCHLNNWSIYLKIKAIQILASHENCIVLGGSLARTRRVFGSESNSVRDLCPNHLASNCQNKCVYNSFLEGGREESLTAPEKLLTSSGLHYYINLSESFLSFSRFERQRYFLFILYTLGSKSKSVQVSWIIGYLAAVTLARTKGKVMILFHCLINLRCPVTMVTRIATFSLSAFYLAGTENTF